MIRCRKNDRRWLIEFETHDYSAKIWTNNFAEALTFIRKANRQPPPPPAGYGPVPWIGADT
jgi:hypothetical protein